MLNAIVRHLEDKTMGDFSNYLTAQAKIKSQHEPLSGLLAREFEAEIEKRKTNTGDRS